MKSVCCNEKQALKRTFAEASRAYNPNILAGDFEGWFAQMLCFSLVITIFLFMVPAKSSAAIIAGYPDGTFRGNKEVTRYEFAQMADRWLQSQSVQASRQEKLVEELRSEVSKMHYELQRFK